MSAPKLPNHPPAAPDRSPKPSAPRQPAPTAAPEPSGLDDAAPQRPWIPDYWNAGSEF